jgi:uncharacterized protein DUF6894
MISSRSLPRGVVNIKYWLIVDARRDSLLMKRVLSGDVQAAQEEAALYLADVARDGLRRSDGGLNQMSIEVRTDAGLFMRVSFSFNLHRRN